MQAQALSPQVLQPAAAAEAGPRLDCYAGIHKALRLFLTRTLAIVGSTDPAEFFAVATEAFFERPQALRDSAAPVYDTLSRLYRLDPAAW